MDSRNEITPPNQCNQLRAAYDTLADNHRAVTSNVEIRIRNAENRTKQIYMAKLGRCERERTAVYQVLRSIW